jgi:subtilisin family serine protease
LSLAALAAASPAAARNRGSVELVVTLRAPSLADAVNHDRALAAVTMRQSRLQLDSPSSVAYLQQLDRQQSAVVARIARAIPGAYVHWRYGITIDGLAVVVPSKATARLARVPGVAKVWPSATYHAALDRTPQLIGAPAVWGPTLANAGQGMKIGIIDEGVDQTHPFFSPVGFTMPAGFPKGDVGFTTAKVIVARAFAPPSPEWKYAKLPFDPEFSEHGTHVAGIAAGDHGTLAPFFTTLPLSGVAPAAYIGNYKALTIPTPCCGLDGNAPEIVKAIDQAVADGMNVINLSLGEPEIEQSRDIVIEAIDGAARAGVVPAIAAGNEGDSGKGTVSSPGSAPLAITAAAATTGRHAAADIIASFSSIGPTPYSLQLKPDVTAPGVAVLSSIPKAGFAEFSGTSMASPHVAGAAALLKQQHPTWTVAQIKSALMLTGDPVYANDARTVQTTPLSGGGGRIDVARASTPLVFAAPSCASFGLMKPRTHKTISISLTDAGGGAGAWTVALAQAQGVKPTVPASVSVPGKLAVTATIGARAKQGDGTGFVTLRAGSETRRIPYWLHVERPKLGKAVATLRKTGNYTGNTAKGHANVDTYRYPEGGTSVAVRGPEQVFGLRLTKAVANFGVRIVSRAPRVTVTPRVVRGNDENRLTGFVGLPGDLNPYRDTLGGPVAIAGAILPSRGKYNIVFDSSSRAKAGKFKFRFWINDVTPPAVRLRGYSSGVVKLAVSDAGAGVDVDSLQAFVDGSGSESTVSFSNGVASVRTGPLSPGKHTVELLASDYQETKNMEDVGPILPNTRDFMASFTV